jgi:hypothetical protein
MDDTKAVPASRLRAALAMLELGGEKPQQPVPDFDSLDTTPDAHQLETIRHIIVEPEHTDREGVPPIAGAGAL